MTRVFFGLGSNLGDRKRNLEESLQHLRKILHKSEIQVSPVYESPALLPEKAPLDWSRPYLNLVAEGFWTDSAEALLSEIKKIESSFGKRNKERWSPRLIDIDLLLFGSEVLHTENLKIPHPEILKRAFVLDPLKDLDSNLKLPEKNLEAVGHLARSHPDHSPLWMGVFNITDDSFSDGGTWANKNKLWEAIEKCEEYEISIFDFGAESTRPGAAPVSWELEWEKLAPILMELKNRYANKIIRPLVSIDTRHYEAAKRALELGIVDILNDVSGLSDLRMLDLLKSSRCSYVLMHSLTIPADSAQTLPKDTSAVEELKKWFSQKLKVIEQANIDLSRIILDPGIGFGKTSDQSFEILRSIESFQTFSQRLLIGHSRKSFMKIFTGVEAKERDPESIGISLALASRGVDILRVHEPISHKRAYLAYEHAQLKN
ncbi:MAG: hypothetical protein JWQ35_2493 [Bacteriovoracaceae bacterium]|nr:hypothetical protein [Bacteriovoracaceae bacterium]